MTDLPVSSINPNIDTSAQATNPHDDVVANLNAILNQPTSTVAPAQDGQEIDAPLDVSATPPVTPPVADQVDEPVIQIDLKKNYVKKQPVEPVPASSYSTSGGSPFGAPRPAEAYLDHATEQVSQPEQVENIISPEVEKSAEVLKPEQTPQPESPQQATEQIPDVVLGKVVDLRKAPEAPKVPKKDVAPNASTLTIRANDEEHEFIESIRGAHGS